MQTSNSVHRLVTGKSTRLRPAVWGFSPAEVERRYRWSADEELQYWSGSIPGGRSLASFRDSLGHRDWPADGKRVSYAILSLEDELIGMISLYNIDKRHDIGELGVYLGEKRYWGSGYGTDALITFLRHLFNGLGLRSVYLHTYASNERAQRSYAHAGFAITDKRRRYSPRLGYHEEVRMAVSREMFDRVQGLDRAASTGS